MLFKQNNKHVNKWKFSSTVDLKKFFIIICLPLIEMIITTILMCKFCDKCKDIGQYKWYLLGLIPSSVIFSLLMVTIRDMRARFPINYVFLFLNTLLLCYAFIPPILGITIGYIMISFSAAAAITFSMIILGMFIKFHHCRACNICGIVFYPQRSSTSCNGNIFYLVSFTGPVIYWPAAEN
ncbi:unnamed protein product [Schistosoma mattheei]|uniref:Uncharacterized protein n=1 Tax=Schistosoma mattheei TaxID=31246 RepID=A0AA85BLS2_9TREM|nr:unnamed protein product [Schistosoma mattheei]